MTHIYTHIHIPRHTAMHSDSSMNTDQSLPRCYSNDATLWLKENRSMTLFTQSATSSLSRSRAHLRYELSVAKDGNGYWHVLQCVYHSERPHGANMAPTWKELFTNKWIETEDGAMWKLHPSARMSAFLLRTLGLPSHRQ